ncbi:ABC transporter permease [Paenibacillus macerans]|uniref:ABC transporter permease n=1 Tax=Paenibacillus macerans TaxID=44252 RepID=UPI00203CCFC0|nr:ABC transporter permease [Paenibacillus macerans]MCM3702489.1 ABC transporter permease [Paenibacillus macerans]
MSFLEIIRVSIRSIQSNKLRSFLTMLGIIIGVAAVIAMVAIGKGSSSSVTSSISGLGSNLLIISPGQSSSGGINMGFGSSNTLKLKDVGAIAAEDSVAGAIPSASSNFQVVAGSANYNTSVEGTGMSFLEVRSTSVQSGRFFNNYEYNNHENVAVIGSEVVTNLFPSNPDPIGERVEINQVPFTVIGVLKSQGSSGMTNNDDRIIVPVTTAQARLGITTIRTIYASAVSAEAMTQAQNDITSALRISHGLRSSEEDDFQITNQSQILETAESVSSVMTTLLSGIAAISLVVGGIGIMNIMLVSVTERTREIGIRKAIGAKRGDIMRQFLIEAVILSLMGGTAGVLFGLGTAKLLEKVANLSIELTLEPTLYSFLSSMAVGIIFGVYPARKAAQLKPIDALRYE